MIIRCSKLARPMVCAGYLFLEYEQSPSNSAADEGTAAGEYLERMLMNKPLGVQASNGLYFDNDMKFFLEPIRDDILSRTSSDILCETRIDWHTSAGVTIKGQYDISFVDKRGYLCIEDLKYGFGIVEVKENWQLIAYAIGEVIRRGQAFDKISLKIHQPRAHHEDGPSREWLITYAELLQYKDQIEKRMIDIVNGNRTLQTSSKCKYCEGAAEACPAFNRLFYRALEVSTEFVQDQLTEAEISLQLDQIKRAEEVMKIKKDSLEMLGISRIKSGKIIPNYMQVPKQSFRSWKTGISAESIRLMSNVNVIEEVFMTPAKAEKAGVSKELVKMLTEVKITGTKLEKQNSTDLGNKIFGTNNPLG